MKEKIVFIGGASSFVPAQVQVVLEKQQVFDGSEVVLFDVNQHYIPLIEGVCKELCTRAGANIRVSTCSTVEKALEGANFVSFMWNVGGRQALRNDVSIPTKHGIAGDETAGIGGTFMAQRNIPVAIDYCRKIERLCPDAWVVSHTNPTNLLADAIGRETKVKFIPICDSFISFSMSHLPRWLGLPSYDRVFPCSLELWPRAIGVNHFTWLVDLKINGNDGYPVLRKKIKEHPEVFEGMEPYVMADLPLKLFEAYGYWCIAPSHAALYLELSDSLSRTRDYDSLFYADGLGWNADRERVLKEILKGKEWDQNPTGVQSKDFCFHLSSARQAIGIMASIRTNEGREWGGINFENCGAIANLPGGAIVEGPSIVNAQGVNPIRMGDLPRPFAGLAHHMIHWGQMSVDAALSGDRKVLYQAILACPYCHDMAAAKDTMQEMLEVNKEYLPQYSL